MITWNDCAVFAGDLEKRYHIRVRFECTPRGTGKYENRQLWSVRAFRGGLGDEEQKHWQEWGPYPAAQEASVTGLVFRLLFQLEERLAAEVQAAQQGRLFPV